jgi:ATP-dependent DNA helicase RecG
MRGENLNGSNLKKCPQKLSIARLQILPMQMGDTSLSVSKIMAPSRVDVKNALELVTGDLQSIIPPPHVITHTLSINRKAILVIAVGKSPTLCSVGGVVYIRIGTSARPLLVQEILMFSSE